MSDTYDTADTEFDESEDSPVIRKLRSENRAKEKALKEALERLEKVESAAQTRREEAAKSIVNGLNLPGLKDDVLSWVEGEITEQSVIEALQARSIPVPEGLQPTVDPEPEDKPTVGLASNVGQRVADAAGGKDNRTLDEQIAQAESPDELRELMEQAGLSRSHS